MGCRRERERVLEREREREMGKKGKKEYLRRKE
jgi:hypothetical protein